MNAAHPESPLLELAAVHFAYPGRPPILRGVDFALRPGERVALLGPNGSGKSTLLHLFVGLRRPSAGEVRAFGLARTAESDFLEVRRRVGLVFQNSDDQLFCPTVLDDVAFGPLNLGRSGEEARAIAESSLACVGLCGFEDRITYHLSGGEKRLVALATVLAMEPDVLLLDEPGAGLDETAAARVRDALRVLPQAMILVSHDRFLVDDLATRTVRMESGTVT